MSNKRSRWGLKLILLSGIMILGAFFTAYGAKDQQDRENQDKIKKIKLVVEASIHEGGYEDLSVRTTSHQYRITTYEFVNQDGGFEAGQEPKLRIYLDAEEECYFPSNLNKSHVSVSGADCTALKIDSELESAEVTVKLKPVEGTLGKVESAWWDSGSPGKAKWSPVDHANAYEVKLYRGNTMVDHKDKVKGTNCNFYPNMDRQGSYTFKVRAIPSDSEERKYLSEGEWTESKEQDIDKQQAAVAPQGNSIGGPSSTSGGYTAGGSTPGTLTPPDYGWIVVQNKWKYRNLDGSFPSNGWQLIDGKWYLFDMSGFMLTGWQHYGGKDYYLTSSGDMVTGWFQENRAWYYLGADGAKVTGWLDDGSDWYYLGPDGVMATGWVKWEDKFYFLNPENGRMLTNTFVDQRYIGSDGAWVQ